MQGEEIKRKIASFPRGRNQFDLKGNLTSIFEENWINRHQQRKKYFFDPLVHLLGVSLAEKRLLAIGCNAGFWSLCARRTAISHMPAEVEQATPAPSPTYAWCERQLRRQLRHRERRVRSLEQSQQRLKQRVRKRERQLQSMQASKTWKLLNNLARVRARVWSLRRAASS
jgi:hypothetical protein